MSDQTFFYDLKGQVISVTAARADLWPSFDLMLGALRVSEAAQPGFRVNIVETLELQENPEGKLAFDGEVPFDGPCRMIDAGEIPGMIRFGRLVRFSKKVIDEFLASPTR